MKMCSKCQRELGLDRFVKSPRYKDGLYPSCKQCRREANLKTFRDHPDCFRCKEKPHLENRAYCYECDRIMKGRPITPKFHRDVDNTKCSRCKIKPRAKGHKYCVECKRISNKEWAERNGGYWKCLTEKQKDRAKVRRFIDHRAEAGTRPRQPCVVCGNPSTEFHHLDYEPRTLNVVDLCSHHHDQIELLKKQGLTDADALEYMSNQQLGKPDAAVQPTG